MLSHLYVFWGTCNMENNPGRSYCTKKQKIKNKLIVLTDF